MIRIREDGDRVRSGAADLKPQSSVKGQCLGTQPVGRGGGSNSTLRLGGGSGGVCRLTELKLLAKPKTTVLFT